MVQRVLTLVAAAALSVFGGCTTGSGADASSGIVGTTTIDAGCPVMQSGTPCPERPLAAHVVLRMPGSAHIVDQFDTDRYGRFRASLAPGAYVVTALNETGGVMPVAAPLDVVVPAGVYVTVHIQFDSGVR